MDSDTYDFKKKIYNYGFWNDLFIGGRDIFYYIGGHNIKDVVYEY